MFVVFYCIQEKKRKKTSTIRPEYKPIQAIQSFFIVLLIF